MLTKNSAVPDAPASEENHVLNELSQRYTRLFEAAQDGILLLDCPECRIEDANPYILSLLGYSKEDLLGNKLWKIGLLADKTRADQVQETIINVGYVRFEDIDLVRKDGQRLSTEFICNSYKVDGRTVIQCNIRDISARKEAEEALSRERARLAEQIFETVNSLSNVIEARDPFTAGHQRRVASLAVEIAREMNLSPNVVDGLRFASQIHDIGKISIPTEILTKPTSLNPMEVAMLRSHAQAGYDILKPLTFPWPIAKIILQHHERLDGSGYPKGLKGDEICLEAKILAVADTVEAMTSNRPYRPAAGLETALNEIDADGGQTYDPDVVKACLNLFRQRGYVFPEAIQVRYQKL